MPLRVSATALILLAPLPAPKLTLVVMSMPVVSVSQPRMVHELAPQEPDPRVVVTPLNAASLEKTLRDLNILHRWEHVIEGLRPGFDIGLSDPVPRTISFSNHNSCNLVSSHAIHILSFILSVLYH